LTVRVLVVMALLFIGAMPPAARTSAYFTSALASTGLTFTSAKIELDSALGDTTAISATGLSGLYPSDTTGTGIYKLFEVRNTGDASLNYHVAIDTSGVTTGSGLANEIRLVVVKVADSTSCSDTGIASAAGADWLYGSPSGAAIGDTSDDPAAVNLAGSKAASTSSAAATAAQDLPSGSSNVHYVCFRFRLPVSAKTTLQGASVALEVRFVGTQVAGLNTT
jgi:hypothetical protein